MPEATSHTDRTVIELAGKIDASLSGAGRAAETVLGRIQAASTRATMSMTTGFAKAERSMTAGLGGMSKSMIGWGIGVATAAAGFATLKGFIDEAMAAFSEEKVGATTRKMSVALANNKTVAAGGTQAIQAQMEAIGKTSEKMEHFSAINEAIYRSAFATMTTYGFNAKQIAKLSTGMADYAAETTGAKTTMEDMNSLAERISKAIASHKIGLLGKELGITAKEWKGIRSNAEAIDLIEKKMEERARGQAAALAKSPVGIAMEAQDQKDRALAAYGELFKGIQRDWTTTVDRMMAKTLPWGLPALKAADAGIRKMLDTLSSPEMTGFWKAWDEDVKKFQTTLAPLGDAIAKAFTSQAMTKDWKEFFANLEVDMHTIETITSWVQKMGDAFDKSADAVERFGKVLRGEIKTPTTITSSDRLSNAQDRLNATELAGASDQDIAKAKQELLDAEEAQRKNTEATKQSTNAIIRSQDSVTSSLASLDLAARAAANALRFPGSKMGNFPIGGGLPDPGENATGFKSYESYPGEGHAANYGFGNTPMRNEQDAHIGADVAKRYGLKHDDMVHIPGVGWRRYHDVSERPHGIELHTAHPGSTPDRLRIDKVKRGDNPPANISSSPVIHVHGNATPGAIDSIKGALANHTRELLEQLERANDEDFRTSFA